MGRKCESEGDQLSKIDGKGRPPDIKTRWLEAFLVTEELRSMTAAAEALGVSQSTVSRDVTNLESALCRPLTTGDVPFSLNAQGLAFKPIAEMILGELEAFRKTGTAT